MNDLVACDAVDPGALHQAMLSAFGDYLAGPFALTPGQWKVFLARHGAEMPLSRAVVIDAEPAAFAFVNPRMELPAWRVAAMGARPAARGTGAAPRLLDDLLARARAAGAQSAELECFQENERALRLYRSRGFEVIHALYGYVREADAPAPASDERIDEIASDDAYAAIDALSLRLRDLPYQVTGRSLRAGTTSTRAWRAGEALLCFGPSASAPGTIIVHSLVDADPAQRGAESLVAALIAGNPGTKIHVPQLQRRDLGGEALERLGFRKLPFAAYLMRAPLGVG
jgi:GNAT superfamily N-acetyltransferase